MSVDLVFKRQFSYYLITIYVPGCMLVIVSWVNFWLDPKVNGQTFVHKKKTFASGSSCPGCSRSHNSTDDVNSGKKLLIRTLITIISLQTASINSALPPVAYTKAIDVWQGVCVGFVFSALMEYALVNYALRCDQEMVCCQCEKRA